MSVMNARRRAAEDAEEIGRLRTAAEGDRTGLRAAFVARGLRALAHMAEQLEAGDLEQAVRAPSDYAVLLSALESEPGLGVLGRDDPLAAARLRGVQAQADLLGLEGGALGVNAVAELLSLTRQAVSKRQRAGRLLAVDRGRHGLAYPAWQFARGGVLPGLEDTLAALTGHDPWMRLAFFLEPSDALGGDTPLAALRRGELPAVQRAARLYGEHGAR